MFQFYRDASSYYPDIEYAGATWRDESHLEAQDIISEAVRHDRILEAGCGTAGILRSGKIDPRRYTGLDISNELLARNQEQHPEARFLMLNEGSSFPLPSGAFDFVFSHYVIEHCVFPNVFLDECARVLRPGGVLAILCPDFLGQGRMASQRSGFSRGTGREKIRRRQYWDAATTAFDNKIRIPLQAVRFRARARKQPQFLINLAPTCFVDPFNPDVDAVYVAWADEMRAHLSPVIDWCKPDARVSSYSAAHSHIYLKGTKKA